MAATVINETYTLGSAQPDKWILITCNSAFTVSLFAQSNDPAAIDPWITVAVKEREGAMPIEKAYRLNKDTTVPLVLGSYTCAGEPFIVVIGPNDVSSVDVVITGMCPDGDQIAVTGFAHATPRSKRPAPA